jgi:hypothetical protein
VEMFKTWLKYYAYMYWLYRCSQHCSLRRVTTLHVFFPIEFCLIPLSIDNSGQLIFAYTLRQEVSYNLSELWHFFRFEFYIFTDLNQNLNSFIFEKGPYKKPIPIEKRKNSSCVSGLSQYKGELVKRFLVNASKETQVKKNVFHMHK